MATPKRSERILDMIEKHPVTFAYLTICLLVMASLITGAHP
jgi:hypothetical protein